MPHPPRKPPNPVALTLLAALVAALSPAPTRAGTRPEIPGLAVEEVASRGEASFHTEVPPGNWRALELKNLPTGTVVRTSIRASADLEVAFVRQRELAGYPKGGPPLFRGRAQRKLEFTVTVPDAGDWEVELDNAEGAAPVTVDITVQAARPGRKPAREEGI